MLLTLFLEIVTYFGPEPFEVAQRECIEIWKQAPMNEKKIVSKKHFYKPKDDSYDMRMLMKR